MNGVTNSYRTEHFTMTLKNSLSPEGVSVQRGERKGKKKKKDPRTEFHLNICIRNTSSNTQTHNILF